MGNFAPMKCAYCGAGPYTGPTLGGPDDDPHAKNRTYDCESSFSDHRVDTWNVTERCAERLLAQLEGILVTVETEHVSCYCPTCEQAREVRRAR